MSEEKWFEPNDLAGIRARLSNLSTKAARVAQEAKEISEEATNIWLDMIGDPSIVDNGSLKRDDGRLNEAGIRAVNAAFEAGTTVTQVAKQFSISVSAASTRRKVWMSLKTGAKNAALKAKSE